MLLTVCDKRSQYSSPSSHCNTLDVGENIHVSIRSSSLDGAVDTCCCECQSCLHEGKLLGRAISLRFLSWTLSILKAINTDSADVYPFHRSYCPIGTCCRSSYVLQGLNADFPRFFYCLHSLANAKFPEYDTNYHQKRTRVCLQCTLATTRRSRGPGQKHAKHHTEAAAKGRGAHASWSGLPSNAGHGQQPDGR